MRQVNLMKNGGKDMAELMTDKQFDKIIKMISMILDGCKSGTCHRSFVLNFPRQGGGSDANLHLCKSCNLLDRL